MGRRARARSPHKAYRSEDGDIQGCKVEFLCVDVSDQNYFLMSDEMRSLTAEGVSALSDEHAERLFAHLRWGKNGGKPFCPKCGCVEWYALANTNRAAQHKCKKCGCQYSDTSGTIFSAKKASIKTLLIAAISLSANKGDQRQAAVAHAAAIRIESARAIASKVRQLSVATAVGEGKQTEHGFNLDKPRYIGGLYLSTRTWWSAPEKAALHSFASSGAPLDKVASALGRTPKSVAWFARDLVGSSKILPAEWAKLVTPKRKAKLLALAPARLSYPYVQRSRPSNADLLSVNDLVPKHLPEWIRADVCQSIMLALYEGTVELRDLKSNKTKVAEFIKRFYREQMPREEISLEGRYGDDRDTYEIASALSAREWEINQQHDLRRTYESNMFAWKTTANQIDVVYEKEIADARFLSAERGELLSMHEVIQKLDAGEIGHDVRGNITDEQRLPQHARDQAGERYGIVFVPGDAIRFINKCRRAAPEDKSEDPAADAELVFIDWGPTKDIPVVYNRRNNIVITVLHRAVRKYRRLSKNHRIQGSVERINDITRQALSDDRN